MDDGGAFGGAKVALFIGDTLVTILRDDRPGLADAGCWDLPGGGREGDETPFDCIRRETREEVGLNLLSEQIIWQKGFATEGGLNWFFVARLPPGAERQIVFGGEGQRWEMMGPETYLEHPRGISRFQQRLRYALDGGCGVQRIPPLP